MPLPMNERDLIDLNAFLDGELTDRERAAFEVRLAQDAALREELRALRATVAILQMAELIRAPRNFTLDPAVYGKPEKGSFWDRLGTPLKVMLPAGAAILATLVCAGIVILSSGGRGFGAAAPMVAEEPAMQMAVEEPAEEPALGMEDAATDRMAESPAEEEAMAEVAVEGDAANAAGEAAEEMVEGPAEPGGGGGEPTEDGAASQADVAGADNAEPEALEAPAAAPMEEAADEVMPSLAAPSADQQFIAPTTKESAVGQAEVEEQAQPDTTEPAAQAPPRLLATGVVVGLIAGALVIALVAGLTLILSRRRQ